MTTASKANLERREAFLIEMLVESIGRALIVKPYQDTILLLHSIIPIPSQKTYKNNNQIQPSNYTAPSSKLKILNILKLNLTIRISNIC